jgi:hypothetical protein
MIDRREILDVARDLSLEERVVEKDYVLGWLLAGTYGRGIIFARRRQGDPANQHLHGDLVVVPDSSVDSRNAGIGCPSLTKKGFRIS